MLNISGNGGYHRADDACGPQVAEPGRCQDRVRAAGRRRHERQRPQDDARAEQRPDIAYMGNWLREEHPAGAPKPSRAMPRKAIPTFATDNIARKGFFFAGGKYVEANGRWECRQQGHARRDVHRGVGAAADPAAVPGRALPRQRADRRGLAADAGRPRRAGRTT